MRDKITGALPEGGARKPRIRVARRGDIKLGVPRSVILAIVEASGSSEKSVKKYLAGEHGNMRPQGIARIERAVIAICDSGTAAPAQSGAT